MARIEDGLCRRCGQFLEDWEYPLCVDCGRCTSLVVLDPDRCPVDGTTLGFDGMDEPALFIHGGYGATRRTVLRCCPTCGWSITREVSEVSPRSDRP